MKSFSKVQKVWCSVSTMERSKSFNKGANSTVFCWFIRSPGLLVLCLTLRGDAALSEAVTNSEQIRLSGQNTPEPERSSSHAIISEAFSTEIVFERLAYMCDTFGPRFSGSQGLEDAISWVKMEAERDGLIVREEPAKVPCWVRGEESLHLIEPRRKKMVMTSLGNSGSTPGKRPLRAPVLVVSSFEELAERGAEAKGKIVVFNVPFSSYGETVAYRSSGPSEAAKHGAVAALIRSISPFGLQTVHAGTMSPASIPGAAISLEDAEMLVRMQRRGQAPVVELLMEAETLPDRTSRNLVIELRGSELPEEFVVFGGHIDSWDNTDGAMDDGGGALISWEVVRLLHSLKLRPRRTIRAVLFVNEENGARGGEQYALDHFIEANRTSIAIETDEGTFTPYGLSFHGSQAAYDILAKIGKEELGLLGAGNVTHMPDSYEGTDVFYMCAAGVPCANLITLDPRIGAEHNNPCLPFGGGAVPQPQPFWESGYFWYHHTAADTPDKLSLDQLQHCAAALAVWIHSIANLDRLVPR